jgi:LIM domain
MALYVGISARSIPALLQLGFGAQIQSISTGKFLGRGPGGTCTACDQDAAQVWYISSRDTSKGDISRAPRAAVALVDSPGGCPQYLSLNDSSPTVSDMPAAVRVACPENTNVGANDVVFGFRQVMQEKLYLSVQESSKDASAVVLSERLDRTSKFRFRVLVGSIGQDAGSGLGSDAKLTSFAGAISLGILELGVRFRLRSVHGRVLRVAAASAMTESNEGIAAVVQDGPKTREDEANEEELVIEAFRRSASSADVSFSRYMFTDVKSGKCLSVRANNIERGRRELLTETAALLVPRSSSGASNSEAVGFLQVIPVQNQWSQVHIGESVVNDGHGNQVQWLMAGMRGRLECRHHRGAWETFRMEFVQQSLDAALRELPPSNLYSEADAADRAVVRAELVAQVSAARGEQVRDEPAKKSIKGTVAGFNHTAALQGLGNPDNKLDPSTNRQSSEESAAGTSQARVGSKSNNSGSRVGDGSGRAGAVSAAVATSALPRNAASKGAKRKGKKKKKKNLSTPVGRAVGSSSSASGAPINSSSTEGEAGTRTETEAEATTGSPAVASEGAAGSAEPSSEISGGSGPPCAACGRVVTGTYTKALGKDFHPQCFCCRLCRRPMLPGHGQFRERGGVPYCNGCFAANIAAKCARCSKPIMETVTTAMEKTWHKECLTCVICRLPLTQQFWLYADKPNEPRCSRCVTGSEEALPGVRYGNAGSRAVNLPGTMFNRGLSTPLPHGGLGAGSAPSVSGTSGGSGRARITTPLMPTARK